MPPPAVTVVTLQAQDVTLTASLPGRVVASAEAELRPQVGGLIVERLFEEGSPVAQGDPLYRIDPRSYQAAQAQAQAALAQAQAQADAARREAERIVALRDRRVASEQTQDSAVAARDAAEAAVKAAEAQLLAAQIDLDRTTITAPLDGVIGLAQASPGALVTAGQANPLAVIRRIDPVRVDVTQSAAEIIRWQRMGPDAALPEGADRTVTLRLADGSTYEHTGSMTAAEPHVDETTGVIMLRMEFANPDGFLLPGMFVLADIPQAQLKDAVLAPQEGVSRDRRGRPVAMVVNDQNLVEERALEIAQDHGNQWVVTKGLAAGDRIIVAGVQRIAPGAPVTPQERGSEDAAAATAPGETAPGETAPEPANPEQAAPEPEPENPDQATQAEAASAN
ncbi:efflux RND transporter periplasmic adaptor subunit [Paracoccus sp. S3-43]|uniref:efflux RND transporter periplasmic adaptor subunit n=1 Tax=Paracoccus sp. S3-43 TaxID=3030011 RepID=UPI0023AFB71E|nr:efflux RND transporter periplasmic adaptor subunit [Paracoccus sp. S3-43]WEF25957.1 efflux RND transporter periplasmic adaptor subunit [Paracoccus sp. S3-43]